MNQKLISVRLDARTVIQVRPGTDIEKLKERYLQRLADSKIEAQHYRVFKSYKAE
jgi:hypothetical protein